MLDDGQTDHIDASVPYGSFDDDDEGHEDEDCNDEDIQQINANFDGPIWPANFIVYIWCKITF